MVVHPAYSTDDYWHLAVKLLTGYEMPLRESLFDKLLGNQGIPLMKIEFSDYDGEPSNAVVEAADSLGWRAENSGWRIENTDFVIPFYSGKHGPITTASVGTKVVMKKARITLLGTTSTDAPPAGGVVLGSDFKSNNDKEFDGLNAHQEWSNKALSQYSYGGGKALEHLLGEAQSTIGFSWNDLRVENKNAVNLKSFEEAADAFDRAASFFRTQHRQLEDWEFDLGAEEASWKGQAAGVFRDLIHGLARNYDKYSDQLPLATEAASRYGQDLRDFRHAVHTAGQNLYNAWNTWQLLTGNPLRWLHDVLLDVSEDVWNNNIKKVRFKVTSAGRAGTTGHHEVKFDGFSGGYLDWGALEDKATWKKIGEEAIRRWQQSVVDTLVAAGKQAIVDVQNSWNGQTFAPVTTVSTNLSQEYSSDKADKDKADAEAAAAAAKAEREADKAEAAAAAAAAKAEHEAEVKQAKAEREAEKAEQAAAAAAAKAEHEAEVKQAKAEREAEKAEQEAEAAAAKAEQKVEQEQAKAERDQKEAEQEAKQEQKEAEQEQKQAEQEAKQEEKEREQQARQEQLQAEQEQKQAEQEAKQEQKEAEQEQQQILATNLARAEREQQKQEQAQKEREQEAKQAEQEARAEAKQQELEAKQEEKEREQEAKQEQKEAEQKQKQAEQEAKQEEKEREQEQRQIRTEAEYQAKQEEQEAKQEAKQAEQEAKQERKEAEQLARQEQLQAEQEQKQAEQEAKQEQKEAEQQARQDQLQAEQEQKQAEQQSRQDQLQAEQERKQEQRQSEAESRFDQQRREALTPGGREWELPFGGPDSVPGSEGGLTSLNPDGTVTTNFPDGSSTTVDPATGETTVGLPDGTREISDLAPGESLHNKDGSWTTLNPDHTLTTDFPDGSSTVVDPAKGTTTTTFPDGTSITSPIEPGHSVPSHPGHPNQSGSSSYFPNFEEELFDTLPDYSDDLGSPLAPAGLGATTQDSDGYGAPGGGGSPMLPMGTRINGSTSGGNDGERVRNVLDDGQQVITRRRPAAGAGRSSYEEVGAARRAGVATSSAGTPFMPPMGGSPGGGGQQTQSSDRDRDSWVAEDEDVWGTDEGGAPAVLGRD
ncbi:AAWKG family protein [Streptomyces sp. NBC_00133]|uniref:AAWKG family protein n=1 Tax=Streptomyces sp. NBC_00133 TaxID=2903624 RepID=UPI00324560DE